MREVLGSEMVLGFADAPGTIWGFEDVRLPYVQAARDTTKGDKKVGQRPLRMIDLWKTVELVLSKEGYTGLLEDPDRKIPEYVKLGVEKIDAAIAERAREVAGIDRDLFVKAFEEQATAYLTFLASQTPSARFATTALSRRDIGKHMGALACKAGLWWAKEMKEPVYYVLDGIKMEQATDYKNYKSAQINQIMDSKTAKDYLEVITFAELREILKNWDELEGWVKFVEKGSIVKGDDLKARVKKWRDDMAASDLAAPARTLPDKAKYADAIAKLDPNPSGAWADGAGRQGDPEDRLAGGHAQDGRPCPARPARRLPGTRERGCTRPALVRRRCAPRAARRALRRRQGCASRRARGPAGRAARRPGRHLRRAAGSAAGVRGPALRLLTGPRRARGAEHAHRRWRRH